jgi:23S rRNA (guanine745-N1)-methyltransferase
MWRCPVCRQALREGAIGEQGASLACSAGHCYDVAREGYVNLLLANRKHSQQPGDNKEMITARSRVHNAGLYQRLAVALQEQLGGLEKQPSQVLDLGCGEGYYSAAIQQVLPAARVFGIDIAKPAVKLAAKRCPNGAFAVASAFDVPLQDSSLDLVVSVFAPLDAHELLRLLAPGGIYLKVTPAPRHLWELRCLLYEQPKPHQVDSQLVEGFESLIATDLNYTLQLDGATLRDLVAMTPYAHKGGREAHDKLGRLEELGLQMCFSISVQRYL